MAYKVPREPTARRVYVWRKLKKIGAVAIQDAVWVLPSMPYTLEQFRWLAAEITEMKGEASLWESTHLIAEQDDALVKQFHAGAEQLYREILSSLKGRNPDLQAISRKYQFAFTQDYFRCELGRQVREKLIAAQGEVQR